MTDYSANKQLMYTTSPHLWRLQEPKAHSPQAQACDHYEGEVQAAVRTLTIATVPWDPCQSLPCGSLSSVLLH